MDSLRVFLILLFLIPLSTSGQKLLSGKVVDESYQPIPFAKIFVKNDADQRTVTDANGYYEMRLMPGEYFLVLVATGYDTREAYLVINEANIEKDIQLFPTSLMDLESVEVSAKKSNPGREIMLKVIAKRDSLDMWNYPHTTHGYIKATEKIVRKEKKKRKKKEEEENLDPAGLEDPLTERRKEDEELANNMNLAEVSLTRHYGGKGKVKEIRDAYELRGSKRNFLYYTTTVKSNFNFFENYLHLDDLHQTPISSPISGPGILSYKYRLVDKYEESGQKINKIKIIPRNTATTTLEGFIYVIDSIWLVQKVEFTMEKGNLLVYDYFSIMQEFDHPGDTLCLLKKQIMNYGINWGEGNSTCKTISSFDEYNFHPSFDRKFFGMEVAVTGEEAYEKDTSFWSNSRKTELSPEEQVYIKVKDSIRDWHNRKEYRDSIDKIFNKVTALKVLWWGVDHRNRDNGIQWTINSLAGLIRPVYIAGPRVSPGFFYFKKWKDERTFDSYTEVSYGFLNNDIKGSFNSDFRYDPYHFGTISVNLNHDFDAIRSSDAITQIWKRDNFIETTSMGLGHLYEIANGLYFETNFTFTERRSLKDYTFVDTDEFLQNNEPSDFKNYQALIADIELRFTPFQRYMREPKRKVVLGSGWPTFYLIYEKGVPGIFGSDVNHDYIVGAIGQTFKLATLGTSKYFIKSGKFLNTKALFDADEKFQRRSEPIWFSNPLYTFQGLDSTLPTRRIYYEAHFVHHDNSAIINKIPFMKKTRIGLVFATGILYIPEHEWLHYELVGGLERVFKLSRRRLRVGVYGVMSYGNKISPTPTWKVSFSILNNRSLKWNF